MYKFKVLSHIEKYPMYPSVKAKSPVNKVKSIIYIRKILHISLVEFSSSIGILQRLMLARGSFSCTMVQTGEPQDP